MEYLDSATLGGGREPALQVGEGGVKSRIPHLRKCVHQTFHCWYTGSKSSVAHELGWNHMDRRMDRWMNG